MNDVQGNIRVRTGLGNPKGDGTGFTDEIETIARTPRQHKGWESVNYKGKRYQLHGGVHTPWFICLNSPITKKKPFEYLVGKTTPNA